MIYWQLFYCFFLIGLTCFGGGYAMISFIQAQVVDKFAWISLAEFTDIVAISQLTPGPVGINMATYVGYTAASNSVRGAIVATLALCLPSFILMILISKFFLKYRNHPAVAAVFKVLRLVVVGLIASAALSLMNASNFTDYFSILLCLAAFLAGYLLKINPIYLLICGGIVGYLYY